MSDILFWFTMVFIGMTVFFSVQSIWFSNKTMRLMRNMEKSWGNRR